MAIKNRVQTALWIKNARHYIIWNRTNHDENIKGMDLIIARGATFEDVQNAYGKLFTVIPDLIRNLADDDESTVVPTAPVTIADVKVPPVAKTKRVMTKKSDMVTFIVQNFNKMKLNDLVNNVAGKFGTTPAAARYHVMKNTKKG